MRTEKVTILNETGLHARPASLFVQLGSQFKSEVTLQTDEKKVNAKSILGVLSLGVTQGTEVILSTEGPDEDEAIMRLVQLIRTNFGEKS